MKPSYSKIQDFINDVHDEISLREYLTESGIYQEEEFRGSFVKCPFHNGGQERTPSMQVTDKFFKCYACSTDGVGSLGKGDIFKFIQQYYNIGFMEAVHNLAQYLNINIDGATASMNQMQQKLNSEWNKYKRDFNLAPKEIQILAKDYFPEEIGLDSSLGTKGYLVLPLTSKTGSIMAFTKRRINDEDTPKWKHSSANNSKITQIANIYNLANATRAISETRTVIITEGPKDCIAYRRNGINNVIAICGSHNVNKAHSIIEPIEHYIISMDNDSSGIDGTMQFIIALNDIGFDVNNTEVVVLPEEKDPMDVVDNLKEYYEQRINGVEWYIKTAIKQNNLYKIAYLYYNALEFTKPKIMQLYTSITGMSLIEAETSLKYHINKEQANKASKALKNEGANNNVNEKDLLLAIVGKNNIEIPNDMIGYDINKAKKILQMKYNIKI